MALPSLKGIGVQQQPMSMMAPQKTPFAATKTGVAVNTVLGLPKAAWTISKGIADALTNLPGNILRTAANVGAGDIPNALVPERMRQFGTIPAPESLKVIPGFGKENITPLSQQVASGEQTLKSKGFGKASLPVAFAGVVGSAAMDLFPGGAPEKNVLKTLVKEGTIEGVSKILRSMKLPEEVITKYADKFAGAKTITEVKPLYESLKNETNKLISSSAPKSFTDFHIDDQKFLSDYAQGIKDGKGALPKYTEIAKQTLKEYGLHAPEDAKQIASQIDLMKTGASNAADEAFMKSIGSDSSIASKETRMAQSATIESGPKLPTSEPLPQSSQLPQQVNEGLSSPGNVSQPTQMSTPPIGEEISGAIQRLNESLKTAKPARGELEKLYTEERSRRAAKLQELQASGPDGTAGYYEQLKALQGELTAGENKAFKTNLIEADIKSLFKAANLNPGLDVWEKLNTQGALMKVLSGEIPQKGELALLEKTFGGDLVENILKNRTTGEKIMDGIGQLVNLPRAVMSSFDLSAPFRQGIALISHPKAFGNAFVGMFKQFGSEKAFQAVQQSIARMPEYELMKQGKLALTDVGVTLTNREEKFMSSWAEKIPGIGSVVKGSNRAYTGFLNKLRADVFAQIINGAKAGGRELDEKLVKDIASFVNTASGRGNIPKLLEGNILNGIFFSPRLMASRITMLNPVKYVTADPIVRKEMFKSLFTVLGAGMTVLGLAKMNGAEIGTDSNSSDFGKIKVGNTRIDIWGGFQQYVRMASQLISGKYVSTTGQVSTLGEGYKPLTRYDIIMRQIESKEAPVLSFITSMLRQQDYTGQPVKVTDEVAKRFVPMVISDLYDLAKETPQLLPAGLLAIFGVGLQSYKPPTYTKSKKGLPGINSSPLKKSSGGMKGLKGVGL